MVWGYTPRQLNGYVALAAERRKREAVETLSLHTLASRGSADALKKQLRELEK